MINKAVWLFVFLISGMLTGCSGGGKTVSNTIFVNNSGQKITITPYVFGTAVNNDVIKVENFGRYIYTSSAHGVSQAEEAMVQECM